MITGQPTDVPLGKNALEIWFGSLPGQGDFGEGCVLTSADGFSSASAGDLWTGLWQSSFPYMFSRLCPLGKSIWMVFVTTSSYLWMLMGNFGVLGQGSFSAHCFAFKCFAAPFLFMTERFLVIFLQWRWDDLRAKLTSLPLENGELVDRRAVIVACVFVIFLCQCGFLSSFLSSENSATPNPMVPVKTA